MFCQNCGKEIPDDVAFCSHCGLKIQKSPTVDKTPKTLSNNKNMIVALIISFILTGLGIAYAGNKKKGIILFIVGLIFGILGTGIGIFAVIGLLIWAYALYETYNEVKKANGESDPNLIEDFKTWDSNKKIGAIIIALLVVLIVISGSISAFAPKHYDDYSSSDYSSGSYSSSDHNLDDSDVSSSSSSSSGDSFSSSSNGQDVSYHYDGEYGSSDTHGKVYDDGSVEAHETGHTSYGDYKIDSYMDSEGNLHGDVEVGGRTYHVSN